MTRLTHMIIFLSIFSLVLISSHFYIYSRLSAYLQLNEPQRRLAGLILGSLSVLTLLSIPLSHALPRNLAAVVDWLIYPWMGVVLLLLVAFVTTDLLWLAFNLTTFRHDPDRRLLFQRSFGVLALSVTTAMSGYSLWNGLREVRVKPLSISLNKLPQSMDGFRIVQITDLHIGPLINGDWLRHVVAQVNALQPDIIAVTGDLVDGSVDDLSKHVAPLADLKAPHGVYFITGNHEYYSGVEPWCAHIASLGIQVLRNERVSITAATSGESFDLAGVDDWGSRNMPGEGPNLTKALAGRDTSKALVLLAHQPAAIHEAATQGVDLQLSGHTHGGQIWPFTYLVYLQQPYAEGLHQYKNTPTQIYVSPGTGFWGPPMRLGTSAEITHITLRANA